MEGRFHPRSSFILLLILFLLALLYQSPGLLLAMLIGMAAMNMALDRGRTWRQMLRYAVPFALLIVIINVIVNQQGPLWWEYRFLNFHLSIHASAVIYGLTMTLRLLVVLSIFTAFNLLLSVEEILEVFPSRRGTAIITVAITARMVPELMQRFRGIKEIQLVRCADPGGLGLLNRCRSTGVLVMNILRAALDGAWRTGEVMQSRGFGAAPLRSAYRRHHWRNIDSWLVLLSIFALILALVFNWWQTGGEYRGFLGGVVPLLLLATGCLILPVVRVGHIFDYMRRGQYFD